MATVDSSHPSLFQRFKKNRWVSFFFRGNVTALDKFFKYVHPITLQFKDKSLEAHYYPYVNETNVFMVFVGLFVSSIVFLAYIILDKKYKAYHELVYVRIAPAAFLFIASLLTVFVKKIRQNCMHVTTVCMLVIFVALFASLVYRDDLSFSPIFLVVMFAINFHLGTFAFHRTIAGFALILCHALVWIFYLRVDPALFIQTQTVTYTLFFITAIIAAYTRELAHRRIYFVVHQIMNSASGLKQHIHTTTNPSNLSYNGSHSNVAVSPKGPRKLTTLLATSTPSPTASLHDEREDRDDDTENDNDILKSEKSEKNENKSQTVAKSPRSPRSPRSQAEMKRSKSEALEVDFPLDVDFDFALEDNRGNLLARIQAVLYKIVAVCLPARSETVISEIGFHESVYDYVSRQQFRISMHFKDSQSEAKYQEWNREGSVVTLRQILLLNILSMVIMTMHDFCFPVFTKSNIAVLVSIRYVVIILLMSACLAFTHSTHFRNIVTVVVQSVCSMMGVVMGLYLLYSHAHELDLNSSTNIFNIYFGYLIRFMCYGYCAMGLDWRQASLTGTLPLIVATGVQFWRGVSVSLSPLVIIFVGPSIAYANEKIMRAEYFMRYHRDEVIAYIRAKEQYEGSPSVIA